MAIRQQGGVFGRNPTFNNVTVDGTLAVDQIVEKTGAVGITLDGVTLKDGNVVLADGKGIDFSATSSTGTSELFDDYEEGTWTPVITANVNPVTVAYTAQVGRYSKVGDVVTCGLFMNCDITGAGIGSLQVSLPFVSAQIDVGSYQHFPVGFAHVGNAEPIAYIGVRYNEASATIYRDINAVTSSASVTGQRWFYVQFSYFV